MESGSCQLGSINFPAHEASSRQTTGTRCPALCAVTTWLWDSSVLAPFHLSNSHLIGRDSLAAFSTCVLMQQLAHKLRVACTAVVRIQRRTLQAASPIFMCMMTLVVPTYVRLDQVLTNLDTFCFKCIRELQSFSRKSGVMSSQHTLIRDGATVRVSAYVW